MEQWSFKSYISKCINTFLEFDPNPMREGHDLDKLYHMPRSSAWFGVQLKISATPIVGVKKHKNDKSSCYVMRSSAKVERINFCQKAARN